MHTCLEKGLLAPVQKCAVTLLGYCNVVPPDKAYFLAGELFRESESSNFHLAYLLLSHYVDLVEAIEEGDVSSIANAAFERTYVIPAESLIPEHQYNTNEAKHEDAREWVLSMCMNASVVDKSLPSASNATGTIFEGLFEYNPLPCCIVTGFPVFE